MLLGVKENQETKDKPLFLLGKKVELGDKKELLFQMLETSTLIYGHRKLKGRGGLRKKLYYSGILDLPENIHGLLILRHGGYTSLWG